MLFSIVWLARVLAAQLFKQVLTKMIVDGKEERWMLKDRDTQNANKILELRKFSVDKEGLPVPVKIGYANAVSPTKENIRNMLERGTLKFHQRIELISLKDGSNISVEWINKKIRDIQWIKRNNILSCREDKCVCH